ncbi:MAG: ImmA/IrrE family metallo-endopeptidase [Dehalococcoidia bacterium]|nr:ImmA/IrrE family metallo-endopeptidase [Dehalococcoidia bacterium]
MSTTSVNPEMIALARESRALSQKELASALAVTQGAISRIEGALLPISDSLLARVSEHLRYPQEFFFLQDAVYGPSTSEFFHRKRQSAPSRAIIQLHAQLNIRRIHIARLMRSIEMDNVKMERFDPDEFDGDIEAIAGAVRAAWMIAPGPIKNVTEVIENAGGLVIRCDFGTRLIDAVSRWVPGLPPLFFVNENAPSDRARWSLTHELGHILMHQAPRPEMESEADTFASAFLMPARDISHMLDFISLPRLAQLKPYWKVSMAALLKRASDLGILGYRQARYLWMQISKAGYRLREPPELDLPIEEPSLLNRLLSIYKDELGYGIDELAALLRIHVDELSEMYDLRDWGTQGRPQIHAVS